MASLTLPDERVELMVRTGLTDVFSTMLGTELVLDHALDPNISTEGTDLFREIDEILVVGNVGFVGDLSGMVYLAMPEPTARAVTRKILGLDGDDEADHEMINDALGELTNMSAGTFKNQLADAGFPCRLTLPSIIRGKYFVVEAAETAFRRFFVFKMEDKILTFEVLMKQGD